MPLTAAKDFAAVLQKLDSKYFSAMDLESHIHKKGGNKEGCMRLIRFLQELRPDLQFKIDEAPKTPRYSIEPIELPGVLVHVLALCVCAWSWICVGILIPRSHS